MRKGTLMIPGSRARPTHEVVGHLSPSTIPVKTS
jgi:hypothetical protein